MLALYLSVLDDRNFEEDFTEVYNTYKRLVYHTAYKIMDDSYLAEDVLQEVLLEDVPNEPDDAPVPADAIISVDNIERLTELIGQMKPKYRDPLRLLAMGYTNREIAKSLGLTDEVVRTRLFRGRKLLWKELSNHE